MIGEEPLLVRRSLHEDLVALVRSMIIEGVLKPGERVPEKMLCEQFGVSRTPLREAVKVLAAEGLIILEPYRGASVAKVTVEEIERLFPIMAALEALAGELAAERIGDGEVAHIQALHDKMVDHYRNNRRSDYARLNEAIHDAIVAAAANPELTLMYRHTMVRIRRVRFVARMSPARWKEAVEDHEAIVSALQERDGNRLAAVLKLHVRHKAATVLETLGEKAADPIPGLRSSPSSRRRQSA